MNKIACIIVTYNRKELLKKCIDAVLCQQCDIIIIDNASTDGTNDFIKKIQSDRIIYKNTGANLGGAGGFNFGIKFAVESGYEYCWIMDDDTIPDKKALWELCSASEKLKGEYGWLSSHALWIDGNDCVMNIQRKNPYQAIDSYQDDIIPSAMASFVSLFIPSTVVREFGLPCKEFFIWTDDWEYTRRISREKKCYTISRSKVVHAMKEQKTVNIAYDTHSRIDRYSYYYRNDIYLYKREGVIGLLWVMLKFSWHSFQVLIKSSNKIRKNIIIWKGFLKGLFFNPKIEFPK